MKRFWILIFVLMVFCYLFSPALGQATVLNGTVKDYHSNGLLKSELNYKNGKLEGVSKYYYFEGKLWKEQSYKNDVLNGKTQIYHDNGALFRSEEYKNGKLNGRVQVFSFYGTIESETAFRDGHENGDSKVYFPNGKLHVFEHYKNGKLEGRRTTYGPDGRTIVYEETYRDGVSEFSNRVNELFNWASVHYIAPKELGLLISTESARNGVSFDDRFYNGAKVRLYVQQNVTFGVKRASYIHVFGKNIPIKYDLKIGSSRSRVMGVLGQPNNTEIINKAGTKDTYIFNERYGRGGTLSYAYFNYKDNVLISVEFHYNEFIDY